MKRLEAFPTRGGGRFLGKGVFGKKKVNFSCFQISLCIILRFSGKKVAVYPWESAGNG